MNIFKGEQIYSYIPVLQYMILFDGTTDLHIHVFYGPIGVCFLGYTLLPQHILILILFYGIKFRFYIVWGVYMCHIREQLHFIYVFYLNFVRKKLNKYRVFHNMYEKMKEVILRKKFLYYIT